MFAEARREDAGARGRGTGGEDEGRGVGWCQPLGTMAGEGSGGGGGEEVCEGGGGWAGGEVVEWDWTCAGLYDSPGWRVLWFDI